MFRSAIKPVWIAAVLLGVALAAGTQVAVTAAATRQAAEQVDPPPIAESPTISEVEPLFLPGLPQDDTEESGEAGTGEALDVRARVSEVARGLLTPSDLQLILRGEWSALADSAKSKLYDLLVAAGATPVEAASILGRDWDSLQYFAKERLAQVLGEQLGISAELAAAVLDGDWEEARGLAQVEAVEELLGRFVATSEATG